MPVWGSPLPTFPAEGCRQNPGVRQVLKFAVNPVAQILAFAAPIGADREERLLLLFRACSIKCNRLREFALEGVRDFVLRAKILGDAVAQNDPALAALAAESGAREGAAPAYGQARSLDARSMDDAMEDAESCAAAMAIWTGSCAS